MNTTTTTVTDVAKSVASTAPANAAKPQRRMARPAPNDAQTGAPSDAAASTGQPAAKPAPVTKVAAVIALLKRENGATLAELIAATGWLPHTTRAALTGLRKKGHVIERSKRGEQTCYRIAPLAPSSAKPA